MATVAELQKGVFSIRCDGEELTLIQKRLMPDDRRPRMDKEELHALNRIREDFALVRPLEGAASGAVW